MSLELKRFLFDAYGGFADKRITRVERGNTFIIDDRKPEDNNGNGSLSKTFCRIFARVVGDDQVVLSLHENAPIDYTVRKLVEGRGGRTGEHFGATYLSVTLHVTEARFVRELAQTIGAMVDDATDTARSQLQRTCSRVTASLMRFADCLEEYASTHPVQPPALADGRRMLHDGQQHMLPMQGNGMNMPMMPMQMPMQMPMGMGMPMGMMPMMMPPAGVNIDTGALERQISRLADVIREAERVISSASFSGGGGGGVPRRLRTQRKEANEEQNAVLKEILKANLALQKGTNGVHEKNPASGRAVAASA